MTKPKTTATNPARTDPARKRGDPGISRGPLAATISVASNSIAVPRCRITVHAGSASFTVTAPSATCNASSPSAA